MLPHRTEQACRLSRSANRRAQLHKRLIECGATADEADDVLVRESNGRFDQRLRQIPEASIGLGIARVLGDCKEPGQHSNDVAVENGCRLIEGNTTNGAGRVAANPRKRDDF